MAKYSDIKHEDLIMKKAMDVFAEEGLKFFGIDKKVKDSIYCIFKKIPYTKGT